MLRGEGGLSNPKSNLGSEAVNPAYQATLISCTPKTSTHPQTNPLTTCTVQAGTPISCPSPSPLISCSKRYPSYTSGATSHTGDPHCHVSISVSICTVSSRRYGPNRTANGTKPILGCSSPSPFSEPRYAKSGTTNPALELSSGPARAAESAMRRKREAPRLKMQSRPVRERRPDTVGPGNMEEMGSHRVGTMPVRRRVVGPSRYRGVVLMEVFGSEVFGFCGDRGLGRFVWGV
ncbi:acyl-CoA N-acyltransferase [Striga asiatica]|uniref:Acyl-CoA N-acyltransferase n=1 Tax=Striga asiatica TaxID=4170 RepID=A0A5A7QMM9_STRAF|nr:acyl-CoA N-acyltransferase [Striga asiatica]